MEYTKGKWEVYQYREVLDIVANNKLGFYDTTIAKLNVIDKSKNEILANARLISAAPEMYEALIGLYKLMARSLRIQQACDGETNLLSPADKLETFIPVSLLEQIMQAIAKAEGKE